MKSYIIKGGRHLSGKIEVSGSKNVVLKAVIAACLTDEEITIKNIPLISDLFIMLDIIKVLGGEYKVSGNTVRIRMQDIKKTKIPLEMGAATRTSSMFVAPLLARKKEAFIPNPGGCRIGARPIDRHVEGLKRMGAKSYYDSGDGYFKFETEELCGAEYTFPKNSHTGTETLILAAVLASGTTVIGNAALEPEVDDLIKMLNSMGAKVRRLGDKKIEIIGVSELHGITYTIMPDRNEAVTLAVLSALTGGTISIGNVELDNIESFLDVFEKAGGAWEEKDGYTRFYIIDKIKPVDITTLPHPGFMTDWQGPWAIFMTQANGRSTIHETIYENRFGYYDDLRKMGANLNLFVPQVDNPEEVYNFNYEEASRGDKQGLEINGPTKLHNAILRIVDLRAGATLVIAALIARGESIIYGVEYLERGYAQFDKRLASIGADIKVVEEKI